MLRQICLALFSITVLISAAPAQIPQGNIFFGYSYLRSDLNSVGHANLNGWNGSLEGKIFPFVGVVADISGYYGAANFAPSCPGAQTGCTTTTNSMYSAIFGPRVSVPVGKFTPFAEALFGVSHITGGSAFFGSTTSFAKAYGGGIDYRIIHGFGFRLEGDLLQTSFNSNTRIIFDSRLGWCCTFRTWLVDPEWCPLTCRCLCECEAALLAQFRAGVIEAEKPL